MKITPRLPKPIRWLLVGIVLCVVGAVLGGGYWYLTRDTSPMPSAIRQQLTFSPFVVPTSERYTTSDYKFSTIEGNVSVLSYRVHQTNGTSVTISEYIQPNEFSDIPEYKDRFLSNVAKQYATVPTSNGTIYLGRMARQDNKQLAVMIERGLMVLMNPDQELDETQWRALVEQFEIQKAGT